MGSDLYNGLLESCSWYPGQQADPLLVMAKLSPVPRNSGAQNVLPEIMAAMNRAKRLREPLRTHAINMAREPVYGYAAIGGEGGFLVKELNTQRISQTQMGTNIGQAATPTDNWLYGKKYLENNPQKRDDAFL